MHRRFGPTASATPLPTAEEYARALLEPGSAFADPELQGCVPVVDGDGRPVASAGSFGVVFRLENPQGRPMAVKCFTRYAEHPGLHQRRYDLIASALGRLPRHWKVDFEMLPKGLLVGREWRPVLKMEWVAGQRLGTFIERSIRRPGALGSLAVRFASLVSELAEDGVAHGDLQDGNILVDGASQLRLIDYGGMYVPGLEPLGLTEKGHEHFQSPDREGDFGPDMDRFAAWVIYASLVALTIDPTLWIRVRAGRQEQLLFNHADFCDPARSPALEVLADSGSRTLKALAEILRDLWDRSLAAIPRFDPGLLPAPALS